MSKTAVVLKEVKVTGAFVKEEVNIRWIPVRKLIKKWASAQREERIINHAKKIAGLFDPDKFGILAVTMADENGNHHLIDGDHRATAVLLLWGPDEKVPCQILPTKDPVRAAEIFLGMNEGRRAVTPVDNFRVSVQAHNPDSEAISKVVRSLGYRVKHSDADGCIKAVGALKSVYSRFGPDVLRNALTVIQATWGMDATAVAKPILQAYGNIIGLNYNKVNQGRLKDIMAKKFATPNHLLGLVKGYRELNGGSSTEAIYNAIVENYNRGLKAGQLERQ